MSGQVAPEAPPNRWLYGLGAVVAGLITILISVVIVINRFDSASDIGAVLGVIVSPIVAMVSAYFGVQAGAAGKEKSDENAKKASDTAIALAAASDMLDDQRAAKFEAMMKSMR